MAERRQNMETPDNWEVMLPSPEFQDLAPELRQAVDEFLSEYPVRLGAIAHRLGIRVLLSTLPRGISGQISQENGEFVIRINRHEAKPRQRFTLAHEIAHYLLHREKIAAAGVWSENVLLRSGQPANVEYEANRLASDLIIPSALLAEATAEYSGPLTGEIIEDLACKFRVSTAAMEIKLQMN